MERQGILNQETSILSSLDTSGNAFSRQEDMVGNPSSTIKTCLHPEDQDLRFLNHFLLSDLDDNLGVQEAQDDFNGQVTDVHQVDRNEDDR